MTFAMDFVLGGLAIIGVATVGAAWLAGRLPEDFGLLERILIRIVLGVAIAGTIGLQLAHLSGFYGPVLLGVLGLAGGLGLLVNRGRIHRPRIRLPRRPSKTAAVRDAALVGVVIGLLAVALPPFPWILGGRDPGIYVNGSIQIATKHATASHSDELAALPEGVRPFLTVGPGQGDAWSGIYVVPDGSARVVPQGYDLFPVLLASAGSATNDLGLWALPATAVLALLSCAFLAARLSPGRGAAAGAAAVASATLLALNVAFVWYARYPMTEMLTVLFVFSGLWLFAVAAPRDDPFLGAVAGVVFGTGLLVRPDAAVIALPAALAALVLMVALKRWRRVTVRFAIGFAVMALLSMLNAAAFEERYVTDIANDVVGADRTGLKLALAAAAGLAATGLGVALRGPIGRFLEANARQCANAALGLAALGLVYLLLTWPPYRFQGIHWLGWYLTGVGALVAAAGLAVLIRVSWRRDRLETTAIFLFMVLGMLVLYGKDPRIFTDQFWGIRRFLPVVIPASAVVSGVLLAAAWRIDRRRARVAALAALGVAGTVTAAGLIGNLEPTVGHVELRGVRQSVDRIDAALGRDDALVLLGPHEVARNRFGVAIAFQKRRHAYPIDTTLDAPPVTEWLLAESRKRPVEVVDFRGPAGRQPPPVDLERIRPVLASQVAIELPEFDTPTDRIPSRAHVVGGDLVVWRLLPRPKPTVRPTATKPSDGEPRRP